MKKWLIGCGLALLIVLVCAAGAGYWFIYRPAKSYITGFTQLAEIPKLEQQISNKQPFNPPRSGDLTPEMVNRFVTVEQGMETSLGARFAELKKKYDELDRLQKAEHRQPSVKEGLDALRDLATIYVDAKRAQVDALNSAQLSLAEYDWIRAQVYAAAGVSLAQLNLRDIATSAQSGNPEVNLKMPDTPSEVPERNKELVKPHLDKLQQWLPFAFFGL